MLIETRYDAAIDSTTASASALNKYLATPNRNMTGKKTMQVVIVDARTGRATSSAPSRAAAKRFLAFRQMAIDVLQHDYRVIDQPAYGKRETAKRHDVDGRAVHEKTESAGQNGKRNREENREGRSESCRGI